MYVAWFYNLKTVSSGDVETSLGPKLNSHQKFSICHWNSNSIATHGFIKVSFLKAYIISIYNCQKQPSIGVLIQRCVLRICSKFIRERLRRSATSIKLQGNFIEITLRHGRSPVNLLHIFRTPFP